MTTYQDYMYEMQDRTETVVRMREVSSSLMVARPEGRRYGRLLARLGSLMEIVARHLRLRAPTVTHHLKSLRAAGLVQMTMGEHDD